MTQQARAYFKAALIAAFCGLVLYARVYVEYPPIRIKLVTNATPTDAGGALAIDVPYAPRLAEQPGPIAVIAEFENPGSDTITVNIAWNSVNIGSATVKPEDHVRADLTLPKGVTLRGDDRIRFKSSSPALRLAYLEFANLHGQARGLVNGVIVPAASDTTPIMEWPLALLIAVALAGLGLRARPRSLWKAPWKDPRMAARAVHVLLCALVALLFLAALFSGYISRYKVLLAWDTFWMGTTILMLRPLLRTVIDLRQVFAKRWLGSPAAFDAIVVALIVAGFYVAVMSIRLNTNYKGNYSGFLQLNREWVGESPLLVGRDDIKKTLLMGDGGYDGMFMYLMVFDPFMSAFKDNPSVYHRIVDTPPYRYTRIGYSLLTRVVAWNHPERYPQTMMWLIIASHFVAVLALGAIFMHYGTHPAWALLYMFIPGFLQSLSAGLPESIAAAFLLISVWAVVRSQYVVAAACLAGSLLVRETGVIFVAMMVLWLWIGRREWRGGFIVGLAGVPLLLWRAFITYRLFPVFGWSSLLFTPGSSNIPFRGIIDLWREIQAGIYYPWHPALSVAGMAFPFVLGAALIVSIVLFIIRRDGLSAAALGFSFLAVTHDYPHVWTHVGNAERVTFEAFLLLLVILATIGGRALAPARAEAAADASAVAQREALPQRAPRLQRALILGFFAFTVVYTVYFSFDAQLVRAVLFSPTSTLF